MVSYELLKPSDYDGNRTQDVHDYDYGDDLTFSMISDIKEWFNRCTLAKNQLSVFGMTITAPNKSLVFEPYGPIDDLTFLQRSFGKIGNFVTAPLNLDSIRNSVLWLHKKSTKNEELEAFLSACRSAQIELVYHGETIYDEHIAKINSVLVAISPQYKMTEKWSDLFHQYSQGRHYWHPHVCGMTLN